MADAATEIIARLPIDTTRHDAEATTRATRRDFDRLAVGPAITGAGALAAPAIACAQTKKPKVPRRHCDGVQLADALRKTNITEYVMIGGPIQFDAKGQNTYIASACIQNRGRRAERKACSVSANSKPSPIQPILSVAGYGLEPLSPTPSVRRRMRD